MEQSHAAGPAPNGDLSLREQWLAFGQKAQNYVSNTLSSAGITVEPLARRTSDNDDQDTYARETKSISKPFILLREDSTKYQSFSALLPDRQRVVTTCDEAASSTLSTDVLRIKIQDIPKWFLQQGAYYKSRLSILDATEQFADGLPFTVPEEVKLLNASLQWRLVASSDGVEMASPSSINEFQMLHLSQSDSNAPVLCMLLLHQHSQSGFSLSNFDKLIKGNVFTKESVVSIGLLSPGETLLIPPGASCCCISEKPYLCITSGNFVPISSSLGNIPTPQTTAVQFLPSHFMMYQLPLPNMMQQNQLFFIHRQHIQQHYPHRMHSWTEFEVATELMNLETNLFFHSSQKLTIGKSLSKSMEVPPTQDLDLAPKRKRRGRPSNGSASVGHVESKPSVGKKERKTQRTPPKSSPNATKSNRRSNRVGSASGGAAVPSSGTNTRDSTSKKARMTMNTSYLILKDGLDESEDVDVCDAQEHVDGTEDADSDFIVSENEDEFDPEDMEVGTESVRKRRHSLHPYKKRKRNDDAKNSFQSPNSRSSPDFWSPELSQKLVEMVKEQQIPNWRYIADFMNSKYNISRSPAQYNQHFRRVADPEINHGPWTPEEDATLLDFVNLHGFSWSTVSECN